MAKDQVHDHQPAAGALTAYQNVTIVRPPANRRWRMTVRRVVLAVALGAAVLVGLWTTPPVAPSAVAQMPDAEGLTFTCAKAFAIGEIPLVSVDTLPLDRAVAQLAAGWTCMPTAVDAASPRFDCRFREDPLPGLLLSQATAVGTAGGQCVPAGLPLPPAP
jgi:hypothetical protein